MMREILAILISPRFLLGVVLLGAVVLYFSACGPKPEPRSDRARIAALEERVANLEHALDDNNRSISDLYEASVKNSRAAQHNTRSIEGLLDIVAVGFGVPRLKSHDGRKQ